MCGQTETRDEYVRRAFRRLPAGSVVISLALVVLLASIATGFEQTVRAWGQAMPLMTTVFVLVLAGAVMEIRLPSGRRLAPVAMTAGLSASVLHAIDGSPDFDVRPAVVILLVASAQLLALLIRHATPSLAARVGAGVHTASAARLLGIALAVWLVRSSIGERRSLWAWAADDSTSRVLVALALIGVCLVGLALERTLAAAARARREHARLRAALRDEMTEAAPLSLALVVPAPMAALTAPVVGVAAIPLSLLPVVLISFSVGLYVGVGATFRQTVRTLARLTEEGGYTPRRHAERVADLARATAFRLGVSAHDVRSLEFAALLHDLGQLGLQHPIPAGATVLAAPHDQQTMANDGAAIIRHNPDLEVVATVVEGQATPYRSVVEYAVEVPLTSRILKVANAFDDLTGGRRDTQAITSAIERMHLGLGYEYDPRVVMALEQVINQRWTTRR